MNSKVLCVALLVLAATVVFADPAVEDNNRGVGLYNDGQFADAIQVFEKAFAKSPGNATVRHNLCNARQALANDLAKSGDFSNAINHLERAEAVEPDNGAPWLQTGSYFLRLEMVSDAIAQLERAIAVTPTNVDAHDLLGDAYYMDNDTGNARIQWEWVQKMQPDRPGLARKMEKADREASVESNFRPTGSKHFQLSYNPDTPGRSLRRVLTILERAYIEVGRNFSNVYPPGPIQVIIYNAQEFTSATNVGDYVGALYDGKIRIPLVNAAGEPIDDADLKQRLSHEYTHVVVRYIVGSKVPWWLNEGLAETFSHDLPPASLDLLQRADVDGLLFPLPAIEGDQLSKLDAGALRLAYAQSHATVRYMWQHFGQARLANLMNSLAEGTPIEEAIPAAYNRSYLNLQKDVVRIIRMGVVQR